MQPALLISLVDVLLSALFTVLVFGRWLSRRKPQHLLWSFALLVWTLAVLAETLAAYQGAWTPLTYRGYYVFGALLVAAWLGAGSLYLVASARTAHRFAAVVALLSLLGAALIQLYPIDASLLTRVDTLGFVEVKVFPFIPVRILVVLSNILGTAAFVGGALYSLWGFRKRDLPGELTSGVSLIALGGLVAAGAHSIGVLGGPNLFRISELAAIALIFSGYVISTFLPGRAKSPQTAPSS
jgi:hypothetical protein